MVEQGPSGGVEFVHRHLHDNDLVLVNRQPTLHKPSIMAHKTRVYKTSMRQDVLRLNYVNCKTYNADFDGDEMNVHFPQDELARAEALVIANTGKQYLVPKDASPLRGLIQDHIVSGVLLTKQDTFLTKQQFSTLLFSSCDFMPPSFSFSIPLPAIFKPEMLWTGKQVVETLLRVVTEGREPLNYQGNAKIPSKLWGKDSLEQTVVIERNELLCGVLEKGMFGTSSDSLVHAVYELYGSDASEKLLHLLGKLFTKFLQMAGFTCGLDDLLFTEEAEKARRKLLEESTVKDLKVASAFTENPSLDFYDQAESLRNILLECEEERSFLDTQMKKHTHASASQVVDTCFNVGLLKEFPLNNFALMTVSGAKGSRVNFSQVSCLLGQQELEGKRPEPMISGKALPSFLPFDPSSRAGGFIANRFLTGLRPQEYFFHAMVPSSSLLCKKKRVSIFVFFFVSCFG